MLTSLPPQFNLSAMIFRSDWAFIPLFPLTSLYGHVQLRPVPDKKIPVSELFSPGQGFRIESLILRDDISTSFDRTYFPCGDCICRLIDLSKLSS